MPPKRCLKMLALHGHAMNPSAFEKRIGALRTDLKKIGVEFVFGQGPIVPPSDWMGEAPPLPSPSSPPPPSPPPPFPSPFATSPHSEEAANEVTQTMSTSSNSNIALAAVSASANDELIAGKSELYSWFDFWSWKRGGVTGESDESDTRAESEKATESHGTTDCKTQKTARAPRYDGCSLAVRTFRELSNTHGPFDGILAFSQGTGAAALWLALEAQEMKRLADKLEEEEKSNTVGKEMNENAKRGDVLGLDLSSCFIAEEEIAITSWHIPQSMRLLRPKPSVASSLRCGGDNESQALIPSFEEQQSPFLLVNVSGVVQRDDEFGPFVTESLRSLTETQKRLLKLYEKEKTRGVNKGLLHSGVLPLRPFHVLNVYGASDAVVAPETTQIMTDLYREICGGRNDNDGGSPRLPYGGGESEWSHEGGHVVPSALRKPLKALIEELYPLPAATASPKGAKK